MVKLISFLEWKDTGDVRYPVGIYGADFSIDGNWRFTLLGDYHTHPLSPQGISINNVSSANLVDLLIGNIFMSIPKGTSYSCDIPRDTQWLQLSGTAPDNPRITFFRRQPTPNII